MAPPLQHRPSEVLVAHAQYSKVTVGGHPVHPMIVGFPIAFYTAGVVSLIVYAAGSTTFWLQAAVYLLFAGVVMAGLAAVAGMVDLFAGIPRDTPARKTGIAHMGLNLLSVVLFAGAAVMTWYRMRTEVAPGVALPIVLGVIALGATIGAGSLGWKLVQTHHVGIDESVHEEPELDVAHRRI